MSAPAPDMAPSPWNLPNALTVIRIAAVPLLAWLWLHDGGTQVSWRLGAFVVFVLAMFTDRLDGQIARSRGIVTDFGKLADPFADKALTGTCFVVMSLTGLAPWWMTIAIIIRELGITVLRAMLARRGVVMAANRGGKLKTAFQSVVIGIAVMPFELWFGSWFIWVLWVLMLATVAITWWSAWEYLKAGFAFFRTRPT